MRTNTPTIILFGALASTGLTSHVYSTFYNASNLLASKLNHDISNGNCFDAPGTIYLEFSHQWASFPAKGPYYLHGFNASHCQGPPDGDAKQEFKNLITDGWRKPKKYHLSDEMKSATSFKWEVPNN